MSNHFYKNYGPVKISEILNILRLDSFKLSSDQDISDVKDLVSAQKNEITFLNSKKYENVAKNTKATYCITLKNLNHILPKNCIPINVDNVLVSLSKITSRFYPTSIEDNFDDTISSIEETKFKNTVKYGRNVLIGKNVSIGTNCSIGHNTIIEKNVNIGSDCSIGSNVIIRNTIIENNVAILDGCIIGKKGFGFFPDKKKNIRYPHIGMVIIGDNVEIGCNNTIDRGSLSNTVIGDNTFLDNQVHIAHNVKIGKNCIITAQVGFAGSAKLGNQVSIGGQAGISGHLNIGNNVQIGGGSGVIKNIPDNTKVMGYPATEIKNFLKKMRKDNE